jgi:glycosyltransferase involved in cell wall biosynthesis
MKICLFRAFPDPFRKSMQIYADQLRNRLSPLLRMDEEVVDCLPPDVHLRPRLKRYWDQYLRYQRFAKLRHGDVNHIIDHGYGHLVRSLPRRTAIVTFHDSTVTKAREVSLTTRLSLRYSLNAMCRAARIVTDSHVTAHDLLQLIDYPADRVRVVYPGVAPTFRILEDCDRSRAMLRLPRRYLLHVGHNLPYMNVEQVFYVLQMLIERGVDLQLVKVGAQFTDQQIRLIGKLGLEGRVTHLGRVSIGNLVAVYNCAEVLLYPAFYAGFGLPPLEAMACGIPVVSSNRGALPEVLGNAALFADPEHTVQFANKVAELLTDRALHDMHRTRGIERAQRYCWDNTARQMLDVYREVGNA